jgi:hypothetical protein
MGQIRRSFCGWRDDGCVYAHGRRVLAGREPSCMQVCFFSLKGRQEKDNENEIYFHDIDIE